MTAGINLEIKCTEANILPCKIGAYDGVIVAASDVDNVNQIAQAIADDVDPAYWLTIRNMKDILVRIPIDLIEQELNWRNLVDHEIHDVSGALSICHGQEARLTWLQVWFASNKAKEIGKGPESRSNFAQHAQMTDAELQAWNRWTAQQVPLLEREAA